MPFESSKWANIHGNYSDMSSLGMRSTKTFESGYKRSRSISLDKSWNDGRLSGSPSQHEYIMSYLELYEEALNNGLR